MTLATQDTRPAEGPEAVRVLPAEAAAPAPRAAGDSLRANTLAMVSSQLATWLFAFAGFLVLPRYLGPERLGVLSVAFGFAVVGAAISGLGLNTVVTREIARRSDRGASLLSTTIWGGLVLGALGAAGVTAFAWLLGYRLSAFETIAVASLGIPLNILVDVGYAAAQGVERMRYQAIVDVGAKAVFVLALLAVIVVDGGVLGVVIADLLMWAVAAPWLFLQIRRVAPFDLRHFSLSEAVALAKQSPPFWAMSVLLVAHGWVDLLLLAQLADNDAAGFYGAPSRIFSTMLFVPTIAVAVAFPQLAAGFRGDSARAQRFARESLRVVLALVVPLSIAAIGLGADLLLLLIGAEYGPSRAVMMMLAVAVIPTSANIVMNRIVIADDRERAWAWIMVAGFAAKVALAFALIPLFDHWTDNPALGAAASLVVAELTMAVAGLFVLPRGVLDREAVRTYVKLALAGLAGAGALFAAFEAGPPVLGLPAVAGLAAYAAAAAAVRLHTVTEVISTVRWVLGRAHVLDRSHS